MAPNTALNCWRASFSTGSPVMRVTEEIHMLHEPRSDVSFSAIDWESNVNELTTYIEQGVFKQTHIKRCYLPIS